MKAIEVKKLEKSFEGRKIFDKISFQIDSGSMTAIIGESGRGKTTLLNCLGQLEDIDGGEILIFNKRISKHHRKKYFRDVFGFLFQNFALIDNETVYQNLSFISKDKVLIVDLLEKYGLNRDFLDKKIYQLSGGEQQRVALIRVLLKQPQIIFADEPTASLDEENRIFVIESLKQLKAQGVTIVVVTHEKSLLSHFDEVINLNEIS